MTRTLPAALALVLALPAAAQAPAKPAPAEASAGQGVTELAGRLSPDDVDLRIERMRTVEDGGPMLNAVIVYDPRAWEKVEVARGAGLMLDGRTVLVKDNIETAEWPTTAGSFALANNATGRDAPLVRRLRDAGGVVLGKTNLSEWANIRSNASTSGWSAIGGLTKNPHALDRNACGSSSGSAAAVAAGLAWAAIGTETDGSITCPASVTGIVGFKPTLGLVSRTHVVPISSSQDTAGPMALTVTDAAALLTAIAGSDPEDPATATADAHATDFTEGLAEATLDGMRIGVLRKQVGNNAAVTELFEQALFDMQLAGAELVEIDYEPAEQMWEDEYTVLLHELRVTMADYLGSSPAAIPVRSLADVIAYNEAHAASELRWFGQEVFERAEATQDMAAYEAARANAQRLAGPEGIDRLLAEHGVAMLVAPTVGPAWATDLVNGDNYNGSIGAGSLAAIAGYPHLTVPMGAVEDLPVGLSFMAGKWSDHAVLKAGAAYEKARGAELADAGLDRWEPAPR